MKTTKLLLLIFVLMTNVAVAQVKWTPRYADGEYNVNGIKITVKHKGIVFFYGDDTCRRNPAYISSLTTKNKDEFNTFNNSYKLTNLEDYENYMSDLFEKRGIITEEFIKKYRCVTCLSVYFTPKMEVKYIYFSYNKYIDKLSIEDIADIFKFILNNCKIEPTKKIEGNYIFDMMLNLGYSTYSKKMMTFPSLRRELKEGKKNSWERGF